MIAEREGLEGDAAPAPKPCVVLDTNILREHLLFRNPLGAALIFVVRSSGGRIGLPEIISEEVFKHLTKAGQEATDLIRQGFGILEKLVGSRSNYEVPGAEQISQSIADQFKEIAPFLHRVPFTLEHAKAALNRVNAETPPNGPKNQQFKDSAIWEAILELAKTYRVHFVTGDKGFFEDRDPRKGLAVTLRTEIAERGAAVCVYYDLSACLAVLQREAPPIDIARLSEAIDSAVRTKVVDAAREKSFQIVERIGARVDAFLTERQSILSLAFDLTYSLQNAPESEGLDRSEAIVLAKGDCTYSLDSGEVTEFRIHRMEFRWLDENTHEQKRANLYAYVGDIVFGHRTVNYEFRAPLSPQDSKADIHK